MATTEEMVSDMTIPAWVEACTGLPVDRYIAQMSHADGPETWGGFLEAALICKAWGRGLVVVMLMSRPGMPYQVLSHVGATRQIRSALSTSRGPVFSGCEHV